MILYSAPETLPEKDLAFDYVRGLVARVLLEHAGEGTEKGRRLAQRDIAAITGADWATVHASIKSLQDEGAIRIERHRLIINKEIIQKIIGVFQHIQVKRGD